MSTTRGASARPPRPPVHPLRARDGGLALGGVDRRVPVALAAPDKPSVESVLTENHGNPEGVAWDPASQTFFTGTVCDGTIYRGTLGDTSVDVWIAGAAGRSAGWHEGRPGPPVCRRRRGPGGSRSTTSQRVGRRDVRDRRWRIPQRPRRHHEAGVFVTDSFRPSCGRSPPSRSRPAAARPRRSRSRPRSRSRRLRAQRHRRVQRGSRADRRPFRHGNLYRITFTGGRAGDH